MWSMIRNISTGHKARDDGLLWARHHANERLSTKMQHLHQKEHPLRIRMHWLKRADKLRDHHQTLRIPQ